MIIYQVTRSVVEKDTILSKMNNEPIYDIHFHYSLDLFSDLNTAKRSIYKEILRLNKDLSTIKEIETASYDPRKNIKNDFITTYSSAIRTARFIYICDTAVKDGSKFVFTINEIYVNEEVSSPYRGKKVVTERAYLKDPVL